LPRSARQADRAGGYGRSGLARRRMAGSSRRELSGVHDHRRFWRAAPVQLDRTERCARISLTRAGAHTCDEERPKPPALTERDESATSKGRSRTGRKLSTCRRCGRFYAKRRRCGVTNVSGWTREARSGFCRIPDVAYPDRRSNCCESATIILRIGEYGREPLRTPYTCPHPIAVRSLAAAGSTSYPQRTSSPLRHEVALCE
jgi:hypothetical protein